MKTLKDVIQYLEDTASELRQMTMELSLPREQYSLQKAFEKVRSVAGDCLVRIGMNIKHYGHVAKFEPVEWELYDGSLTDGFKNRTGAIFHGSSLSEVVNACLSAHQTNLIPVAERVQEAQDIISAATAVTPDF